MNVSRAQAFCIHKVAKVVVVYEDKKHVFTTL